MSWQALCCISLSSRRIIPSGLLDSGYRFRFPELEAALRHELENGLPKKAGWPVRPVKPIVEAVDFACFGGTFPRRQAGMNLSLSQAPRPMYNRNIPLEENAECRIHV